MSNADTETSDEDRARLARAREWAARVSGRSPDRFEPASADASFRCYFRAWFGGESRIVMDAPPALEDSRPFVEVAGMLAAAGLAAPAVLEADLEAGLLLLEDMGTTCYLDVLDETSASALYAGALQALVRMQQHVCAKHLPAYDRNLLMRELALFPDWFLSRHLAIELAPKDRRTLEQAFEVLTDACLDQPQVFVHRDYHSRNLMRGPDDGAPRIIDFQDAVRGPLAYDLVSLLRDVYVAWPDAHVREWVRAYRAMLVSEPMGFTPPDEDQLFRWFDLTGAQRHLKIAGIFCRLWHRDGKAGYLKDIPLSLDYLQAECGARPELHALGALLERLDVRGRMAATLLAAPA